MVIDSLKSSPIKREFKTELTAEEIQAIFEAASERRETEPAREVEQPPEALRESSARPAPQPVVDTPAPRVEPLAERVATPRTKSERLVAIENVMSIGLEELYAALPAEAQQSVKAEGEKTAHAIESLIESGKIAAKKVLHLLRGWLEKIPGVNAFFLEQESKIKTDRIMAIARKTRGE